ncbi:MAG TPA: FapA family protein, partial [Chitinivibrionales bacterium]
MANPLARFFPVEDRTDGVYIKVTRENVSGVTLNGILAVLDAAMILNPDARHIGEVLKQCHGVFEKIGPPFELYNPAIERYVDVSLTPLKAVMKISSMCLTDNVKPTAAALVACLQKKGVKYGVKPDVVGAVLQNALFDRELVVAEGKLPIAGTDASVHMEVDINHNFKPLEKNNGTVDYRNINTITQIKNSQVIAKKIPATKGEPGKSVSGDEIPANPGKDVRFPGGKNTRTSDDGLFLVAAKNGFVYLDGEVIHVGDILPIPKDVDFSVGNIKYSGDIQIQGGVLPGFSVETEGAIVIHGQVEAARIISRNGAVSIQKGIIGKGESIVSGKGGIATEFVQDAVLVSEGAVTVNKFCLNADVTCESFEAKDVHALVIGGSIKAFSHIEIHQAGNENGVTT